MPWSNWFWAWPGSWPCRGWSSTEKQSSRFPDIPRATHFVALRIPKEACERLEEFQERLKQQHLGLEEAAVPLNRSHVTLLVTRLTREEIPTAKVALAKAAVAWSKLGGKQGQLFQVKGVGHFVRNAVLYAAVEPQEVLQALHNVLEQAFSNANLPVLEEFSSEVPEKKAVTFLPHVTLLKASQVQRAKSKRARAAQAISVAAQSLKQEASSLDFGSGTVGVCELLDMRHLQEDGYYDTVASVDLQGQDSGTESAGEGCFQEAASEGRLTSLQVPQKKIVEPISAPLRVSGQQSKKAKHTWQYHQRQTLQPSPVYASQSRLPSMRKMRARKPPYSTMQQRYEAKPLTLAQAEQLLKLYRPAGN